MAGIDAIYKAVLLQILEQRRPGEVHPPHRLVISGESSKVVRGGAPIVRPGRTWWPESRTVLVEQEVVDADLERVAALVRLREETLPDDANVALLGSRPVPKGQRPVRLSSSIGQPLLPLCVVDTGVLLHKRPAQKDEPIHDA